MGNPCILLVLFLPILFFVIVHLLVGIKITYLNWWVFRLIYLSLLPTGLFAWSQENEIKWEIKNKGMDIVAWLFICLPITFICIWMEQYDFRDSILREMYLLMVIAIFYLPPYRSNPYYLPAFFFLLTQPIILYYLYADIYNQQYPILLSFSPLGIGLSYTPSYWPYSYLGTLLLLACLRIFCSKNLQT